MKKYINLWEYAGEILEQVGTAALVTTAAEGKVNTMTIGWGTLGVEWGKPLFTVFVRQSRYTKELLDKNGEFTINVPLKGTDRKQALGFCGSKSGRDVDKFANLPEARTQNGVRYVQGCTNAVISGKVVSTVDCGTHTLFIAEVTDAKILSEEPSVTYQYYFDHIKPKPQPTEKKSWVCKICGYVYEGETLPADYECPWCKHGPEAFEEQ